jgi:hypothetical protein
VPTALARQISRATAPNPKISRTRWASLSPHGSGDHEGAQGPQGKVKGATLHAGPAVNGPACRPARPNGSYRLTPVAQARPPSDSGCRDWTLSVLQDVCPLHLRTGRSPTTGERQHVQPQRRAAYVSSGRPRTGTADPKASVANVSVQRPLDLVSRPSLQRSRKLTFEAAVIQGAQPQSEPSGRFNLQRPHPVEQLLRLDLQVRAGSRHPCADDRLPERKRTVGRRKAVAQNRSAFQMRRGQRLA